MFEKISELNNSKFTFAQNFPVIDLFDDATIFDLWRHNSKIIRSFDNSKKLTQKNEMNSSV